MSSRTLEDIAEACDGPRWFQLYTQDNDGPFTEKLVRRAEAAGYGAIVLTVDLAVPGRREREMREAFDFDLQPPGNLITPSAAREDPVPRRFTWKGVDWLRGTTSLPVVLKGIMTADDATLAVNTGADGVWVSNHGGRCLTAPPPRSMSWKKSPERSPGERRSISMAASVAAPRRSIAPRQLLARAPRPSAGRYSAALACRRRRRSACARASRGRDALRHGAARHANARLITSRARPVARISSRRVVMRVTMNGDQRSP